MASTTSCPILRMFTKRIVSQSSKCSFSTTPIQISMVNSSLNLSQKNPVLTKRNFIVPFKRNMVTNPLAMGNPNYEEDDEDFKDENPAALLHFEAMERWRDEAQKLYEIMNQEDILEDQRLPEIVSHESVHQVQSLMEELIDNDLLDLRLSWTVKVDY